MFAVEHEGVRADVLVLGKALGGGLLPVSAVCASPEVLGVFHPGEHGSTFGGNPLAAAVACEALDVLVEERLPERSAELGARLMAGLRELASPHVEILRGRGLFVGVVIRESSGPARPFCERLMEGGLLCKDTHRQVIRLAPPLVIEEAEVDWAVERLGEVLAVV
jgi:ornithine--oxo-acid transaminase